MDEDALNTSVRKFLKKLGVTAQREMEKAVRDGVAQGRLNGSRKVAREGPRHARRSRPPIRSGWRNRACVRNPGGPIALKMLPIIALVDLQARAGMADNPDELPVVARFEVHRRAYLAPDGTVLRPLPSFASDPALLIPLYRAMVLARAFDLKAVSLQRTGRLGTYAVALGQEAVGSRDRQRDAAAKTCCFPPTAITRHCSGAA